MAKRLTSDGTGSRMLLRPGPRQRACVRYESADWPTKRPVSLMRQTISRGPTTKGRPLPDAPSPRLVWIRGGASKTGGSSICLHPRMGPQPDLAIRPMFLDLEERGRAW
jgi:hypothetical protein